MKKALQYINALVANAQPDDYNSVSYNKYFKDMTNISNTIMEGQSKLNQRDWKIIHKVHELPEGPIKNELLELLKD